MDSLKHIGTLKGQVLKTIAVEGFRQWSEIRDSLGFTDEQLKPLIKELKREELLEEKHGGRARAPPAIRNPFNYAYGLRD